jgi:DNA-binding MarR family transcriptional regulator
VQGGDLTAEVVEQLFTVVEHLHEAFDRAAAGADLSLGQAKALRHLAVTGPVAMRDLASRMRCDASNVTGIVDRLEARGLVVRRVADRDRRVKSLCVTADGQRVADKMWRQVCAQAAGVLEMSNEESSALVLLLRRAGTKCSPGACDWDAGGPDAPGQADARRPSGRQVGARRAGPANGPGAPTTAGATTAAAATTASARRPARGALGREVRPHGAAAG